MSLTLLLLILVCPLMMWLMMRGMDNEHEDHDRRREPTPLELLERRYARGEITREEFEQARDALSRGPGSRAA